MMEDYNEPLLKYHYIVRKLAILSRRSLFIYCLSIVLASKTKNPMKIYHRIFRFTSQYKSNFALIRVYTYNVEYHFIV